MQKVVVAADGKVILIWRQGMVQVESGVDLMKRGLSDQVPELFAHDNRWFVFFIC